MTTISYQLYSSRKFPPLVDTLAMLDKLGYSAVEGYGALYAELADPARLRADLDAAGLAMPTGHIGLDLLERDGLGAVALARTLGMEAVFVPHIAADQRPADAAGWRAFGARLQTAGAPLRDAGLAFGWHNHDFEFADLGGGEMPLDHILAGGPGLALEFDVAWAVRGGQDPLGWIDRYGRRILAAHVKDMAPVGDAADEDGWADVGHGTMDWPGLVAALGATACRWLVLEHDNPADDARFANRSLATLRAISGQGARA